MPMMVIKAISPTNHQANPIRTPPNKNQSMFPRNLINVHPNWIYQKPKPLPVFYHGREKRKSSPMSDN
jgi:hypothetical protein